MSLSDIPVNYTVGRPANWGLAVVMAKGPNRGQAAVFVDGVKVATANTYSATSVNRTVVWRQTLSSAPHSLRVVNLATAGHPRIDVDAFVAVAKDSYMR